MSEGLERWLGRLERKLDSRDARLERKLDDFHHELDELREAQRSQAQTLYGVDGNNGLKTDVAVLKEQQKLRGYIPTGRVLTAIGLLLTAISIAVGLLLGLM